MNKKLKITGFVILGLIGILYIAFLLLPFIINVEEYVPLVQNIVKEQLNMNLEIKNPRLIATPLLEAGLKAESIKLTLSDNSPVLETDKIKAKIFLPSLTFLTVRVSSIDINNSSKIVSFKIAIDDSKVISFINDVVLIFIL